MLFGESPLAYRLKKKAELLEQVFWQEVWMKNTKILKGISH